MLFKVAWRSLLNRKATVLLTVLSVAVAVFTLLGVEHIRQQAKTSFTSTVSGTDLIVGARTSPVNLLLYSTFRIGNPTNNVRWDSYQHFAGHRLVEWAVPIALGDSHRGYRVMGTTNDYFEHFRYGQRKPLAFAAGRSFTETYGAVLGADVAASLQYQLGDELVLAHGLGQTSFAMHSSEPFTVVGVLQPTGTPVDQTVLVALAGLEAVHDDGGHEQHDEHPEPANQHDEEHAHAHAPQGEEHGHGHEPHHEEHVPAEITAFMLGLRAKAAAFTLQRDINNYEQEPLTAILPGVALTQLWQMMGSVERVLRLISLLVFAASMLGLSAMLMASMRERRREISVLRAIGAGPGFVFFILQAEALLMVAAGTVAALAALQLGFPLLEDAITRNFGVAIAGDFITFATAKTLGWIAVATVMVALFPAVSAYRQSLHGGLSQKL